jgi:DNA-binding Lrp family transcriptional regulator
MQSLLDPIDLDLLDNWQRNLPLVSRPFAEIASRAGCSEDVVLQRLQKMLVEGRISRVGATCAPNTVSASTLAALSAPAEDLEEVARIVGSQPGINHSYERENLWNLWFVATGPDRAFVHRVLESIRRDTGLQVLDLRLVRPFNIDLGFRLDGSSDQPPVPRLVRLERLQEGDNDILQALTFGLPICSQPYLRIADSLGRSEEQVLSRIADLQEAGIISRFGVIVRHRALGWRSNAMVVWDIESKRIDAAGPALAKLPGITLCYERRPVEGVWPYRLYCMIHARNRQTALETLQKASALPELDGVPHEVLFSSRCFKQTGALISSRGAAA